MKIFSFVIAFVVFLVGFDYNAWAQKTPGDDQVTIGLKSVDAEELRGILSHPEADAGKKALLLRRLAGRPFAPEAMSVAEAGLRASDPVVMQALSEVLVGAGRHEEALAVLTDMSLNPVSPYDRWIAAVGLTGAVSPSRKLAGIRQSEMAVAQAVEQIRKGAVDDRREFLRALGSTETGRYVLVFTPCRAVEQFLADALAEENTDIPSLAVKVIGRDPNLYYFPARGIPALARLADAGGNETASTAQAVLRNVIGQDKPNDRTWLEWGSLYAQDGVLLEASLARARNREAETSSRSLAVFQTLSLALDAGPEEFARYADAVLGLAQDERETEVFRVGICIGGLMRAIREGGNPEPIRGNVVRILFSWLESPSVNMRVLSVNRLVQLAGSAEEAMAREKLTAILGNDHEPYILRAAAALNLYFMRPPGFDATELARTALTILKECGQSPDEQRAALQIRGLLGTITGLPGVSNIADWEKALEK